VGYLDALRRSLVVAQTASAIPEIAGQRNRWARSDREESDPYLLFWSTVSLQEALANPKILGCRTGKTAVLPDWELNLWLLRPVGSIAV
jgi:hypothetical protein